MKTHLSVRRIFFAALGTMQAIAFAAFLVTSGLAPAPVVLAASQSFPALESPSGQTASLNWAGYVAESGSYTAINGSWTIPSVPATGSLAADATWVGIGGVKSSDLIQAGTQAITDSRGNIAYSAWYELLPQDSEQITTLTVRPGDLMTVSLSEQSTNQWLIALTDATTGQSFTKSVSYESSHSSAEWIQEMPTGVAGFIPLDTFGSVSFTGANVVENGTSTSAASAGAAPMVLITDTRQTLATPSALGSDGSSFTVTRSSAVSTAPTSGTSGNGTTVLRGHRVNASRTITFRNRVISYFIKAR